MVTAGIRVVFAREVTP